MQTIHPLTSQQQDILAQLDANATTFAKACSAASIAGVLTNLKPAALIEDGAEFAPLVKQLGLEYVSFSEETGTVSYDLAKAEQLRDDIRATWGKKVVNKEIERRIGETLGYPATAVEYFIKRIGRIIAGENVPMVEVVPGPDVPHENFIQLILSPENYKEEIAQYAKPLEEATKQLMPLAHAILLKDD